MQHNPYMVSCIRQVARMTRSVVQQQVGSIVQDLFPLVLGKKGNKMMYKLIPEKILVHPSFTILITRYWQVLFSRIFKDFVIC